MSVENFEIDSTLAKYLSIFFRYLIWVGFTALLVTWAVSVTRWIAPAAAGSGIPEMKTIMRSPSVHKEYVKWPVLVAKLFGLVLALGSRLPGMKMYQTCTITIVSDLDQCL